MKYLFDTAFAELRRQGIAYEGPENDVGIETNGTPEALAAVRVLVGGMKYQAEYSETRAPLDFTAP